ncbi:MAG: NAD+ synthase [Bacteroidetes bacterium]|nr:NAD+ synthase [Bacteroidota bacterium]
MKLALAQINTRVGDLDGNAEKVRQYCEKAHSQGVDLMVLPELTLPGYPPLDLLEYDDFVVREHDVREKLAQYIPKKMGLLIGGIARHKGHGKPLHNAAYLYEDGQCIGVRFKQLLPTYDVFDERRYFEPETNPTILLWRGLKLGVHICEDLWNVRELDQKPYAQNPVLTLAQQAPDLLINLCASPFAIDKHHERHALIKNVVTNYNLPYIFTNLVGANTDIIFDGRSCVIDNGQILEAPAFKESLLVYELGTLTKSSIIPASPMEQALDALTLGIRDYIVKSSLPKKVYIGLSGGIDSAVTAALAVRALGPESATGVAMPSKYSSQGSLDDASRLASNLGIELIELPIHQLIQSFDSTLHEVFDSTPQNVAEENIQARTRGTLLMALANKFGGIVLVTGNKSELAMGYATLYGDMNGGLSVLGDLYKTEVYELARLINNRSDSVIPESTIVKPPSAELRPNQMDSDSLPEYPVLDAVLKEYIEEQKSTKEIAKYLDFSENLVRSITTMVNQTEYKRQQAAPVLRLREKAFGSGRRIPVVKYYG